MNMCNKSNKKKNKKIKRVNDHIEIFDIKLLDEEVVARVSVNGNTAIGHLYCDLETFFKNTHIDNNSFHWDKLPTIYDFNPWVFDNKPIELKSLKGINNYFERKKIIRYNKKIAPFTIKRNSDFQKDRMDRNFFKLNLKKHSETYLDTCSCGEPGCSGINNGIQIIDHGDFIEYRAQKKDGYPYGILNSKKYVLRVSKENILKIRAALRPYFNLLSN